MTESRGSAWQQTVALMQYMSGQHNLAEDSQKEVVDPLLGSFRGD
jgi:hypothetical protein